MFSTSDLLLLTVLLYAWLLGSVAWGRPHLGVAFARSPHETSVSGGTFSQALEALWLGSLAVVLLYPIVALLSGSTVLTSGLTVRFLEDEVAESVGIALVLIAGVLVGWAFRSLGRFATVAIRISPDHTIVRTGPYRWIRHPMYSANMLLSAGVALLFLSLPLVLPFTAIVVLSVVRARVEEQMFLRTTHLRQEYSVYLARTGRFLPLLHGPVGGPD